jgi:hypothetical protein
MDDADPFLHPAVDEGFMRLPGIDRDEDLLVVQYGHDENTPVFFTNNASYNFNVGLFDDPLISEHASGKQLLGLVVLLMQLSCFVLTRI